MLIKVFSWDNVYMGKFDVDGHPQRVTIKGSTSIYVQRPGATDCYDEFSGPIAIKVESNEVIGKSSGSDVTRF